MKVLIIGLDGGSWNYIEPILDELPTIKKLVKNGCYGSLESTIPPITIPAWVSMFTGKNPGKLGVVGFTEKIGQKEFKFVNSKIYRKNRSLWDILSSKNIKSLVLNIPFTYPPYKIDGHMICFDFAPGLETNPQNLKEQLVECGLKDKSSLERRKKYSEKERIKIIYEEENSLLNIYHHLVKRFDYDLYIVRFGIPDHVSHVTTNEDEIFNCFIKLDNYVNEILKSTDFEYVFIVSDHGLEKVSDRLSLNNLLLKNGFLKTNNFGRLYLLLMKILSKMNFNKLIKIYQVLRTKIGKVDVFNFDATGNNLLFKIIDFDSSLAYAYQSISLKMGCIYLLDTQGIDQILRVLSSIRDPSGDIVFSKLLTKNNVFSGCKTDNLPDILVFSNKYCITPSFYSATFFKREIFTHSLFGIFLAYGKGIKKGVRIEGAKIYDIAPTILHIFGLPILNDMDGRVLTEIFEENSEFAKRKPIYVNPMHYEKKLEKSIIRSKIKKFKGNI